MTLTKTGARVGRPPGSGPGENRHVAVRLPPEETAQIDELIGQLGDDRSAVLRELIKRGLAQVKRENASRARRMSRQRKSC